MVGLCGVLTIRLCRFDMEQIMKERPILMNAAMVRATLDGSKTQTRRIVNAKNKKWINGQSPWWKRVVHVLYGSAASIISCRQPTDTAWVGFDVGTESGSPHYYKCPHGQPGDRLYVRETWSSDEDDLEYAKAQHEDVMGGSPIFYFATEAHPEIFPKWRPSIHMPRWASRITLEIVSVRVERLQDISDGDVAAEGCKWNEPLQFPQPDISKGNSPAQRAYCILWESINGKGSWDANPWVWVIEFKKITK